MYVYGYCGEPFQRGLLCCVLVLSSHYNGVTKITRLKAINPYTVNKTQTLYFFLDEQRPSKNYCREGELCTFLSLVSFDVAD